MANTPPFDRLTQSQRIALISILRGDSTDRTVALAQVTDRTVRRWRKQPAFQEALAEARLDYFSACRSQFNASLVVAFQTLVHTAGASWDEGNRLKAALSLLDRVSHSEMSAKPVPDSDKPHHINDFAKKPGGQERRSADIGGHPRTSTDAERTREDAQSL